MNLSATIQAVFTGGPKTIADEQGTWTSSIFRDPAVGPIAVTSQGLAGDRVTQPYHGGAGAAVCVHLADHYAFWNTAYQCSLKAGSVGENVTVDGVTEDGVCAGDSIRMGTALVQVSGPRVPCANLARRIGRSDWVKLTIRENRTGFYLRVLEPGFVEAGDAWTLEDRMHETASISRINRCMYLEFDPEFARSMLEMSGLEDWWRLQAREKLDNRREHWTSTMST